MTESGKALRMRRVARDGRILMIPMDHGASNGPIRGLADPALAVRRVVAGGATAVVVHKGLVRHIAPHLTDAALIVHMSVSTDLNPDPNDKRLVATADEVVALGADVASIHVNIGADEESAMVEDMGAVSGDCVRVGLPLLAMMYPRGHDIDDPHDVDVLRHVARLGAELGADIVKCPYSGDPETFREVVDGCPVPVVISGGPRMDTEMEVLEMVDGALRAGAAGVSMGRNAFQAADPTAFVRSLAALILERRPLETVAGTTR